MVERTDGGQTLLNALSAIRTGGTRSHGGLAVVPLLTSREWAVDYVLLEQAISAGTFTVTEVGEAGCVPYLTAVNEGPGPVLIFDGEELAGANQNRICNATILVGVGTRMLPVSCVEEGRWSRTSAAFSPGIYAAQPSLRMEKEHVFRAHARADAAGSDDIHDYLMPLSLDDEEAFADMVGVAIFFDGRFVCVDLLQPSTRFRRLYPKLLRDYAFEALVLTNKRAFLARNRIKGFHEVDGAHPGGPSRADAGPTCCGPSTFVSWLQRELDGATTRLQAAVDLGEDLRLQTAALSGTGLIWNGALLQLSLFPRMAA